MFGRILKPNSIVNPFAPKRASIHIELNIESGQANVKSDVPLPLYVMARTFLQLADNFIMQMAQADAMLVKPNDEPKEGGNNGEKEDSDNRGN